MAVRRDCDAGVPEYLKVGGRGGGKGNSVFMKLVDYHAHDLVDIPESFAFSGTLRDGAEGAQRRTPG